MKDNSLLADTLEKLSPLLDDEFIGMLGAGSVWNLVLGVMPVEYKGKEERIMVLNRRDSTDAKIGNIRRLTYYGKQVLASKPDFSREQRLLFSQALSQLLKYAEGDSKASESLGSLKGMYIEFMSAWYAGCLTTGSSRSASWEILQTADRLFSRFGDVRDNLYSIVRTE